MNNFFLDMLNISYTLSNISVWKLWEFECLTKFKNWVNLKKINVILVINETDTSVQTERTGRCARQPLQTHLIKSNLAMGRATKIRRSCKGAYTQFGPAGTENPPSGQQF